MYEDRNQIIVTFGGMGYLLERSWKNFWECPWYEPIWVMITSSIFLSLSLINMQASLRAQLVKNPPAEDPSSIPGSGRPAGEGIGYPLEYLRASLVAQLVKNPQWGRLGFDPWVGKISWRRERLPTPVLRHREFYGLYSAWGRKELDTSELLSLSRSLQRQVKMGSLLHACSATLCNPMDCSSPGPSVHRISQARILEWAAISFSRGSSQIRDGTCVSCIGRQILYH